MEKLLLLFKIGMKTSWSKAVFFLFRVNGKNVVVLIFQDRFLPIANVARIMKHSVPKTGKVGQGNAR